ncbi:SH3 domain-containing protein [Tenacibaculum amylolyticum]|uniref:SH3 domain-containing protein n=1 Tax=Tenacibaculum amylolyticum TaxID=104269 RepID=UPI003895F173
MKKILIAIMSLSLMVTSCKTEGGKSTKTTNQETSTNEVADEKTANSAEEDASGDAICLLDKLSVRETPTAKGKWITSMSLGEKVYFTGEKHTDSVSKKDYYKVKLIDGKEGWSRSTFLAVDGKVGVMLKDANVYKRPDLLTKTDTKYSPMDIIAVVGTQDDWAHVKGKRGEGKYIEEVWVKAANISEKSVDIATAKFAGLAMNKETMTERIQALQEIVDNADFADSSFMDMIKDKIRDYQSKNQVTEDRGDALK